MHISQTVAVALIAVAGTLGSGALSYLASRKSTDVQLRAITSEMEKVRASHVEDDRRERQEAYYGLITAIDGMMQYVYGIRGPVTDQGYVEMVQKFDDQHTRVLFLGSSAVTAAANRMLVVFGDFTTAAAAEEEAETTKALLKKAFESHSKEWAKAKKTFWR